MDERSPEPTASNVETTTAETEPSTATAEGQNPVAQEAGQSDTKAAVPEPAAGEAATPTEPTQTTEPVSFFKKITQLKKGGQQFGEGVWPTLVNMDSYGVKVDAVRAEELAKMNLDELEQQPEYMALQNKKAEQMGELKGKYGELPATEGLEAMAADTTKQAVEAAQRAAQEAGQPLDAEGLAEVEAQEKSKAQKRIEMIFSIIESAGEAGFFDFDTSRLLDLFFDPDAAYRGYSTVSGRGKKWGEEETKENTISRDQFLDKLKHPKDFAVALLRAYENGEDALNKGDLRDLLGESQDGANKLREIAQSGDIEKMKLVLNNMLEFIFKKSNDPLEAWGKIRSKLGKELQPDKKLDLSLEVFDFLKFRAAVDDKDGKRWKGYLGD